MCNLQVLLDKAKPYSEEVINCDEAKKDHLLVFCPYQQLVLLTTDGGGRVVHFLHAFILARRT